MADAAVSIYPDKRRTAREQPVSNGVSLLCSGKVRPLSGGKSCRLLDLSSGGGVVTAQSYWPIPAENTAEEEAGLLSNVSTRSTRIGDGCRSRPHARPHARPHTCPHTRPDTRPPARPSAHPYTCPHTRPHTRPPARPHSAAPEVQLLVPLLFVLAVFFDKLPFVLSSSG